MTQQHRGFDGSGRLAVRDGEQGQMAERYTQAMAGMAIRMAGNEAAAWLAGWTAGVGMVTAAPELAPLLCEVEPFMIRVAGGEEPTGERIRNMLALLAAAVQQSDE